MSLSFEMLAKCEPKLLDLENKCEEIESRGLVYSEANTFWYTQLKPQLYRLIGWGREHQHCNQHCILFSSEAWDVAYRHFIDILKV